MGNDLFEYMKKKSDKLFEKDENKQKMAAIRKELYMKKGIFYLIQLWTKSVILKNQEEIKKTYLLKLSLLFTTKLLKT